MILIRFGKVYSSDHHNGGSSVKRIGLSNLRYPEDSSIALNVFVHVYMYGSLHVRMHVCVVIIIIMARVWTSTQIQFLVAILKGLHLFRILHAANKDNT